MKRLCVAIGAYSVRVCTSTEVSYAQGQSHRYIGNLGGSIPGGIYAKILGVKRGYPYGRMHEVGDHGFILVQSRS